LSQGPRNVSTQTDCNSNWLHYTESVAGKVVKVIAESPDYAITLSKMNKRFAD